MMNMESRNQHLEEVRGTCPKASKKEKTNILNEALKITKLNGKTLIRKLKVGSNIAKKESGKRKKPQYYNHIVLPKMSPMFFCLLYTSP